MQQTPTAAHPLGCDNLGRDFLAVCAEAVCRSMSYALLACGISIFFGALLGVWCALKGGIFDRIVSDAGNSFRSLDSRLIIFLLNSINCLTLTSVYALFTIFFAMRLSYQIRGRCLSLISKEFIQAAKLLGGSRGHLASRHLLPHLAPFLMLNFVDALKSALLNEGLIYAIGFSYGNTIALGGLLTPEMFGQGWNYDDRYWLFQYVPRIIFVAIVVAIYHIGLCAKRAVDKSQRL